jgi:hypothetical protein
MEMVRRMSMCVGVLAVMASGVAAADFSLTIGNPIAAAGPGVTAPAIKRIGKNALFAVRLEECPALDRAQISGAAEGVVDGVRVHAPITVLPAGSPGVYVASVEWNGNPGVWVVSISASCGTTTAGALVPIGPQGFVRDKTRVLPRAASKAEIDAALKTLEEPGR